MLKTIFQKLISEAESGENPMVRLRGMKLKEFWHQLWVLPNLLSIARLLSIPIVVHLIKYGSDTATIIVMALVWSTDYIDGFIARKFNLKTELGLCLDPLADKVVSIAVFITLYLFRGFPLWILIIVVIKDLTILIAGYYLLRRGSLATSDTAGRQTTVIVSAIILLYLFRLESLANILCYLLILLIITTLYNYAKRFFRELKQITLTTSQGNPR